MIEGKWSSCICDICAAGPGTCVLSFALPCVAFGLNSEKLLKISGKGDNCCSAFSVYLSLWMVMGCLGIPLFCIPHCRVREQVRQLNHIHSDWDICMTICFFPCAMIQEARLLSDYEREHGLQGYGTNGAPPVVSPSRNLAFLGSNNTVHPAPTQNGYPQPTHVDNLQSYPPYQQQIITNPQPNVIYPEPMVVQAANPEVFSTPRRGNNNNNSTTNDIRPFQTPQPATPATPHAQPYEAPREYRPVMQSPFQTTATLPSQPYYVHQTVAPVIGYQAHQIQPAVTTPRRNEDQPPSNPRPTANQTPVAKIVNSIAARVGGGRNSRSNNNSSNPDRPPLHR